MRKAKKKTRKLSNKVKKELINRYMILSDRAHFFTHEINILESKRYDIHLELDLVVKQLGGIVSVAKQLP